MTCCCSSPCISVASFLDKYKVGCYVLQVHVSDVDTNLHCIAVRGQQVADPEDGIWRPLNEESFSTLSIDAVNFGLEVRGRAGGEYGGVDVQQPAGGMEVDAQGHPVKTEDSTSPVCLTSTLGSCESLAEPDVCGVSGISVDKHSPAVPSGLLGRSLSPPVTPSSHAQRCFQLLGETFAQPFASGPLKQLAHALNRHPCKPRLPSTWSMAMRLTNPVTVAEFLRLYKSGRYVLQVAKAEQGLHFVAVREEALVDPEDGRHVAQVDS